ncbi:MAG TPA: hypothetical protein VGM08_04265 [Candidatus Saccharimonadales bacterium]|jgi:hypothetical protein
MPEQQGHTPNPERSRVHAELIDSARKLLESPSTEVSAYSDLRQTTRREKAGFLLGKLFGVHKEPLRAPDLTGRFHKTPKAIHTVWIKPLVWHGQFGIEYGWSLRREIITDADTREKTELLAMRRETVPGNYDSPDGQDARPQIPEEYNLLDPAIDIMQARHLQARLKAARAWELQQHRPNHA